jgi:hypothetical protein
MTNSMLRGIAVGLIIATVLFSAAYYFSPTTQEKELTKESIDEYLTKQDLVAISKQEYEELQVQGNQDHENESSKPEQEEKEEELEENKEEEAPLHSYTLSIVSGMNSLEIANLLEKNQIIPSAKEFNAYLTDNELNTLIQIGTYDLSSDMSFESIANMITK